MTNSIWFWIFIVVAVLTSPIWIIGIYVNINLSLQYRRCPTHWNRKDRESLILMPESLRKEMRVCDTCERRLKILLRKENEVLGEYPNVTLD
jgi:hypothetical protein